MKKRIAAIALLVALVPATLMATPWFQVGGFATFGKTITDMTESEDFGADLLDFGNYGFGAEVRLNLFNWVSVAVPASFTFGDDAFTIGTQPSVNLNLPVASWLDIAVGPAIQMDFTSTNGEWLINGAAVDDFDGNAILGAKLAYRGALTFNIPALSMSLGVSALVPTDDSFQDFTFSPSWEETKLSVSALFNIGG